MGTVITIAIILFVIILLAGKKKTTSSPPAQTSKKQRTAEELKAEMIDNIIKNIKITVTTSSSNSINKDESIIDITGDSYRINSNNSLKKYASGVPYWAHHYVYSYSEINSATAEQQRFYGIFKSSFLSGEYFDLEGNSNYAFILLFDLLNDYDNHRDITKLEKHLQELGRCYPKTKSYGISFLIQKMESRGDRDGISRLRAAEQYSYQGYNNDYDYWRLGSKYKSKLNLKEDEVKLLNKLWYPDNNFCSIEFCFLEILKLYLLTIEELKNRYKQEGTTLDDQFLAVADVIARKHFKYKSGSSNYKYCIDSTTNELYSNIFKHCENAVRELYGHKRKLNTDTYYTAAEAKAEFETKIVAHVTAILPGVVLKVAPPDEATAIELNAQNTNRWKITFEELCSNYSNNPAQFIESIVALGKLNKKNPSVENIFFEGSKFISKHDKQSALTLYVHYLHHDLKSATFDNKQLTKTIQKNLFKTNEELHDFEIIVSELIKDKDLKKALEGVSKIYTIKRKKIKLDTASIKKVQEQHSGTVELLNEYLKDEYEDENSTIKTQQISQEEVSIEITQKTDEISRPVFVSDIPLKEIHTVTLEFFAKSNFSISQSELESFARSKGVFKNQLIESINEACYESLDDVLIEEEDDYYTINTNYYQRLLTK